MTTPATPSKREKSNISPDTQKQIDNHKKTVNHVEAAAKSHIEAATRQEQGTEDKTIKSIITAQGHTALTTEIQRTAVKNHALNVK